MNKTPEQINQFIHKAMGLCRHAWERRISASGARWICIKENCSIVGGHAEAGDPPPSPNPNYLEYGESWGEMLQWAKEQAWIGDFKDFIWEEVGSLNAHLVPEAFPIHLFAEPPALATEIVKYLEGRD